MWSFFMPPRFCRQHQAQVLAALSALGGKLDTVIERLAVLEGRVDMADQNLDQIAADLPALTAGVQSALSQITTLSAELAQTPPTDPRAAELDQQIQAATKSISDALTALSPAPAPAPTPAAPVTPTPPAGS